jgi:non-heme chloroperoxidase
LDIKRVLDILDINDAVLVGFSMGGAIAVRYVSVYNGAHVSKLVLAGAAAPLWTNAKIFHTILTKVLLTI